MLPGYCNVAAIPVTVSGVCAKGVSSRIHLATLALQYSEWNITWIKETISTTLGKFKRIQLDF